MKCKKLVALVLVLAMVLIWIPVTVQAETVTNEAGHLYFTTFEDLKAIASNSYAQSTYCRYVGDGALVIQEDLTVASNLEIASEALVIPAGVTFTIPDTSCIFYVDHLTVEGVVVNNGYLFLGNYADPGTISLNGTIQNNGVIDVWGVEIAKDLDSITYGQSGRLLIIENVETMKELKEALAIASAATNPHHEFDINLISQNMVINESVTVPRNANLNTSGYTANADQYNYILANGCILTVEGVLRLYCPLIVEGTLRNNNQIYIQYANAGRLDIRETGSYTGLGWMFVLDVADNPSQAFSGLDSANFHIKQNSQSVWRMCSLVERLKLENALYDFHQMDDLHLDVDGIYRTPDGAKVYIAVNNAADHGILEWLLGGTLYYYVEQYGDTYFDTSEWEALKALMDENGYVELTEESLGYLITLITGNPAWGETEADIPNYLFYDRDSSIENTDRLAGSNRFETATKVADQMKETLGIEQFDAVILANGYNFADALSGSYLAAMKGAPILLTWNGSEKYNYLNDATIAYVKENLKSGGTVYILGGTSAVPASIDAALSEFNVKRMDGANRFETNVMILEEAGVQPGDEILVCTSTNFADSLSGSATVRPILLVWNEGGKLFDVQTEYLSSISGENSFCVLGGESAVSAEMAALVGAYGDVTRLAGTNRFETSVLVAEKYFPEASSAVLAYAWDFPDGLCGGSLAYAMGAPLILTMTKYETQAAGYVQSQGIEGGVVLGGTGLISDESVRAIFAMEADARIAVK